MTRRLLSRTLAVVTTVLAAVGGPLIAMPAADEAAAATTLYSLVNDARADRGLDALERNAAMDAVASGWAEDMAAAGALSHNPSYSKQLPGGWTAAAENVAQGQPTPEEMHAAWMGSSKHAANILGDFTDIGVAFIESDGVTWGVEVFAAYPAPTPQEPEKPKESEKPGPDTPAPTESTTTERPATEDDAASSPAPTEDTAEDEAAEEDESAAAEMTAREFDGPDPAAHTGSARDAVSDAPRSDAGSPESDEGWSPALSLGIGTAGVATAGAGVAIFLRLRGGGRHRADVPAWRAWLGSR